MSSSSSEDEIEVLYDSSQDTSTLTEEQVRLLEIKWPIDTLYNRDKIIWLGSVLEICPAKIIKWNNERRQGNVKRQRNRQHNPEMPCTSRQAHQHQLQRVLHSQPISHVLRPEPQSSDTLLGANENEEVARDDPIHRSIHINDDDDEQTDDADEFEDENANLTLSSLHSIFPVEGLQGVTSHEFCDLFKNKLRSNLRKVSAGYNLYFFVDSSLPGNTAAARLHSLGNVTQRTCVPLWIGCSGSSPYNNFERLHENPKWKYIKFYDIYKLKQENPTLTNLKNSNSTSHYRKFGLLSIVKILASRVIQSQILPQYTMEFINTINGCTFLARSINHVQNQEALETARTTMDRRISLLCPALTFRRCNNPQCEHVIHLDQLELLYEVDVGVTEDDRNGIPANLYRVQTFRLGKLFQPWKAGLDNHVPRGSNEQNDDYQDFNNKLDAYRTILNEFYMYVLIAVHMDDKSHAPAHLTLEMIRQGQRAYLYVGRSLYSGMPTHHMNQQSTNIGRLIQQHKLNVFWLLRNEKCNSFLESELLEAVYQVMALHLQKVSQFHNLVCSNIRLECSALDFLSNEQIRDLFEMMKQPHFQFLYDTIDHVPPELDFKFLQKPLILNDCHKYF